jgi:hypothetical protein
MAHAVLSHRKGPLQVGIPAQAINPYVNGFLAIFDLSMDFCAWGAIGPLVFGAPACIRCSLLLSSLQTLEVVFLIRAEKQ